MTTSSYRLYSSLTFLAATNDNGIDSDDDDDDTDEESNANLDHKQMEAKVAFCCYNCHCSLEKKKSVLDDPFIYHNNGIFHRRCCHYVFDLNSNLNWKPPRIRLVGTLVRFFHHKRCICASPYCPLKNN
jgi:hypothetical protein